MTLSELGELKKVHFIGIGGIGVSAIARKMLLEGTKVAGSDQSESPITEELKKLGAEVYIGHRAGNLADDADLVVYTIAIPDTNSELVKAKELGIRTHTYPEMLGAISAEHFTVAISGTHGKTTTTAMLGKVARDAKLDPTVIVGSIMKDAQSNLIVGQGKYLIAEACEYRRSFLNLFPKVLVITNIDAAHLDYYKDLADVQKAFSELVAKMGKEGVLVCNPNDPHVAPVAEKAECLVVDYTKVDPHFTLKVPGEHNIKNAQAATAAAGVIGVSEGAIRSSLAEFSGTWRRLEDKGLTKEGAHLYDDYAHEPEEVAASLSAIRGLYPDKKITVVFRPHLYSRTKTLLREFGMSFKDADEILVTDIYAAREPLDPSIHARDVVAEIGKHKSGATYVENFVYAETYLRDRLKPEEVVITMGAGDIYELAEKLAQK
ncbi:MAG: UDP-N-acetylmuramate--L-alanine ligase [Patescibacteria group bacterium]